MSFEENLAGVVQRASRMIEDLDTEEATKTALVMPFISALGYDVFNPKEVIPEFTADVGTKKGEKVDYAIARDGEIVMLIECKKARSNLNDATISQLFRYFTVTSARLGVLTNGVRYRFFSDLEAPNRMDDRPFLEVDLTDLRELDVTELEKLTKQAFDLDKMLSSAAELKFLREIKGVLVREYDSPSEAFVRLIYSAVCPGSRFTASAREQFSALTRRAYRQFVSERVSSRLRTALEREEPVESTDLSNDEVDDDGVVTTMDEIEGFHIVKAIVRDVIEPKRVVHRDTKSYFGVLIDDNNRKPLCRLHFNRKQRYVELFDSEKRGTRHAIESLNDIYALAQELRDSARRYAE